LRCRILARRGLRSGFILYCWRTVNRIRNHQLPPLRNIYRLPGKQL
jgi:hypothetical protein